MLHGSPDAWAVGDSGTILHWTGTTWESMTSPTNAPLYAIQMIDANNGWAGGGNNATTVLSCNLTSQYGMPTTTLLSERMEL